MATRRCLEQRLGGEVQLPREERALQARQAGHLVLVRT